MINRDFWMKVAEKWSAKDDGIEIPDLSPIPEDHVFEDLGDLNIETLLEAANDLEDLFADYDV